MKTDTVYLKQNKNTCRDRLQHNTKATLIFKEANLIVNKVHLN